MARHLIEPNIEKKKKVQLLNLWKVNDCSPYKSSFANGSYFCMTLCVAIATVATQEREKKRFIQEAYWPYSSCGIADAFTEESVRSIRIPLLQLLIHVVL